MLREVCAAEQRILGPEHPDTLTSRSALATCLEAAGKRAEAAALDRVVLAARERVLGAAHPDTLKSRGALAACLNDDGKHEEAA